MSKPSKIDRLPEAAKEALHALIPDRGVTQSEKAERVSEVAKESGHAVELNRYDVGAYERRMKRLGERMRQSREVAQVWADKLDINNQGQIGRLSNELLRTITFDITMRLGEMDLSEDDSAMREAVGAMGKLALIQQRLERASTMNADLQAKIEKRAREAALHEAADRMEDAAQSRGLSKEDAAFWREQVLMGV